MGYRRVFIIRKDLGLSAGKLAAMVGHCAEAYWTRRIRNNIVNDNLNNPNMLKALFYLEKDIVENYINGLFVKTICQARNKNHLLKAKELAKELGLIEGDHFGLIYDNCLTELTPEEENGTTLVGIWFAPLSDEVAHKISKKYHLYM